MEITPKKREELVWKYFRKTPAEPVYLPYYIGMGVSLLLLIYGHSQGKVSGFFYLILGIIGLIICGREWLKLRNQYTKEYKLAEPKATDQQMDEWLKEGTGKALAEARKRLDIEETDESTKPLAIDGPTKDSFAAPGRDRVLRFKRHNILFVFLTEHHVATFQCILDLGPGEILQDSTREFPYKDITNLETHTTNDIVYYRKKEKAAVKGIQTLSLYTSGGNVSSVNYIFNKNTSTDPDEYILPPSTAEDTIKAIRKRLKEYKDKFSTGA